MSVINRIPLINTILSGLTSEQLTTLRSCVNGQGGTPVFRSCKPLAEVKLTASDKGIKPIRLEVKDPTLAQQIYEGYLIYTDDGCWVISFANDGAQCLLILSIDEDLNVTIESTCCSVLELRSELDDVLNAGGGGGSSGGTQLYNHHIIISPDPNRKYVNIISTKAEQFVGAGSGFEGLTNDVHTINVKYVGNASIYYYGGYILKVSHMTAEGTIEVLDFDSQSYTDEVTPL